jgi:2-oxo-3-hexenedioate decarboxylase
MTQGSRPERVQAIADEAFAILGSGRQIACFSARFAEFDLAEAHKVVGLVRDRREARGERRVGRKIGFTNRAVWSGYCISGPIWNYMFDSTVKDQAADDGAFALGNLPEPRIEPEIVLHLARAPQAGMDEDELIRCIDWVAHGFEIVSSIFAGWTFTAADAVAAYGVHSALLIGNRHDIASKPEQWAEALSNFSVTLVGDHGVSRHGHARNVLGGPLQALRFLVEELARFPECEPLRAGETVTTGTLTEAMPIAAGETWSTELSGTEMRGLQVSLR